MICRKKAFLLITSPRWALLVRRERTDKSDENQYFFFVNDIKRKRKNCELMSIEIKPIEVEFDHLHHKDQYKVSM